MPTKPLSLNRRRARDKLSARNVEAEHHPMMAELRRRAETYMSKRSRSERAEIAGEKTAADTERSLHELQVHQIELEMQNEELQAARVRVEALLEKYTDLYDFTPVGYFSLDEKGVVVEVNLTGATMVGIERSRLVHSRFQQFVAPTSRLDFLAFLGRVFARPEKQVCEATVLKQNDRTFWAAFHAISDTSLSGPKKCCRMAVMDISPFKRADEAQRRLEALTVSKQQLEQEIVRRQAVEETLRKSEQHKSHLLEQSRLMEEQLRQLSHQLLFAQEEERKKISRELHDVIGQTLTGIILQLARMKREAATSPQNLAKNISGAQRMVEKSVSIVQQFSRELRPMMLDDLGLVPTLRTFAKSFTEQTGIHVKLKTLAAVDHLSEEKRTALYRVFKEAFTNVARHAEASRVEVTMQNHGDHLCMKIKDNGKGFLPERVLDFKRNKRLGLVGMRERMEVIEGKLTIKSAPKKGATLLVQIPLNNGEVRGALKKDLTRENR